MTAPHGLTDGDMLLLCSVSVGNPIDVDDAAGMVLPDPANPGRFVPAPAGSLDRLEDAGFVTIEAAGAAATDRGRYWLDRWFRQKFSTTGKRRGRLIITEVRATKA